VEIVHQQSIACLDPFQYFQPRLPFPTLHGGYEVD